MTKSTTQAKNWMFTLNNPEESDHESIAQWDKLRWCVWQKEKGENGTVHFQGYSVFESNVRLSFLKKLCPRAHWEKRLGNHEQAKEYCTKEETRIEGPWTVGEEPCHGRRTDLASVARDIVSNKRKWQDVCFSNPDLVVKYPRGLRCLVEAAQEPYDHDDVRGLWYWGPPGSGKSRKAYSENPDAFIKAQNKWFDGYEGQEVIILDDFDKKGTVLGHYLKIWADRYRCTGEVKGGTVQLAHRQFIVTSNYQIEELFQEDPVLVAAIERRFNQVYIGPDNQPQPLPGMAPGFNPPLN
jgi:hypothetical protein